MWFTNLLENAHLSNKIRDQRQFVGQIQSTVYIFSLKQKSQEVRGECLCMSINDGANFPKQKWMLKDRATSTTELIHFLLK